LRFAVNHKGPPENRNSSVPQASLQELVKTMFVKLDKFL